MPYTQNCHHNSNSTHCAGGYILFLPQYFYSDRKTKLNELLIFTIELNPKVFFIFRRSWIYALLPILQSAHSCKLNARLLPTEKEKYTHLWSARQVYCLRKVAWFWESIVALSQFTFLLWFDSELRTLPYRWLLDWSGARFYCDF